MRMPRYWLPALFLLLVSIAAPAQKKEFDKAKKAGRQPGQYYVADFSKKDYTKEEVLDVAKQNGYVCRNIKEDVIVAYGARKRVAISVEFLPKGEDLNSPASLSAAPASSAAVATPNTKKILSVIEKAVKNGLDPANGCFVATFPESTSYYTVSAVEETLNANGYYIKSLKSGNREQVNQVLFVPHDRFPEAIYATYYPKGMAFSRLKRGSAWFPDKDMKFGEIRDVYWAGPVSQGKISGEGYGFQFVSQDQVRFIKGDFEDGKPVGAVYFRETIVDKVFRNDYRQTDPGYAFDMRIRSHARNGFSWFELLDRNKKAELTGLIDNNLEVRKLKDLFTGFDEASLIQDFDSEGISLFQTKVISGGAFIFAVTSPVECAVDRSGTISFSNAERQKILGELREAISDWDLLCNAFSQSFSTGTWATREKVETLRKHIDTIWDYRHLANTIDVNGRDFQQFLAMEDLLVLDNAANANVSISEREVKDRIDFGLFGKVINGNVADHVKMDFMDKKREAAKNSMSRLRTSPVFKMPGMEETFSSILVRIDERDNEFQNNIAYVRRMLPQWISEKAEGRRVDYIVQSAEVDAEESYSPYGEIQTPLLGRRHYKNDGQIRLQNGDILTYNVALGADDKPDFYYVTNSYLSLGTSVSKDYESYEEMEQEFISYSRNKRL